MGTYGTLSLMLCQLLLTSGIQVNKNHYDSWDPHWVEQEVLDQATSDIPEFWKTMDLSKMKAREAAVASTRSAPGPETVPGNTNDVCMTKGCVQTAALLLSNMDELVKPCDDFYHFVCGNYIKNTVIPQTSHIKSYFYEEKQAIYHQIHNLISIEPESPTKSDKDIRNFFISCMNEDVLENQGLEPVMEMLINLDITIPMMNAFPSKTSLNINHVLKQLLMNLMADTSLFGLDVTKDLEDSKDKQVLTIYPPVFKMPGDGLNDLDSKAIAIRRFFKNFYFEIAKQYRNHIAITRYQITSDRSLEMAIDKFMNIEAILSNITNKKLSLLENVKQVPFQEFQTILDPKISGGVDIPGVIKHVVKELTGVELTPSTRVNVPDWQYFKKLSSVLAQEPDVDLINLMVFQKMIDFAPYTNKVMRQLENIFSGAATGLEVSPPRWSTCVGTTVSYFGAKVSQMLINDENGTEIKNLTLSLVKNLKGSFAEIIKEAKWMDAESIAKAQEKLNSLETLVVFSNSIQSKVIEHVYEGMPNMASNTLVANIVNLQIFWTRKCLATLTEKPQFEDVDDKAFDTGLVNAMYAPEFNAIWIPLGILHSPFFQSDRLSASNFGALGMVLGHELTHAFDNTGALFDKNGIIKNWWSEGTKKSFVERQKCFVDQYSKFKVDFLKLVPGYKGPTNVDGKLSLGENIADNGGLREAWRAYNHHLANNGNSEPSLPGLSKYNNKQIFFMSYASMWCTVQDVQYTIGQLVQDVHPPNWVRVTATLQNMEEFAQTFGCQKGDPMVEDKPCRMW